MRLDRMSLPYREPVQRALQVIHDAHSVWEDRGAPCDLLDGQDTSIDYDLVIPKDHFRAFLTWGVDGVHEGFWIDDPDQDYEPWVVMASPMDFDQPIIVMAATAEEWIEYVAADEQLPSVTLDHWPWVDSSADEALSKQYYERALERRVLLGLPPIPELDVDVEPFL